MFNYDNAMQNEENGVFTNIHTMTATQEFEPETDYYDDELENGETVYYVDENILKEDNVEKYAEEKIEMLPDLDMLKLALNSTDIRVGLAIENVKESLLELLEREPDEILDLLNAEKEQYEE